MTTSPHTGPNPPFSKATSGTMDRAGRNAGVLLLLTAATTILAVLARVSSDTDQTTLVESLRAIADNRALYGAGGAARILSGVTLVAAAWFLLRSWAIQGRLASPPLAYLVGASGLITAVSGACAVLIALFPGLDAANREVPAVAEVAANLRWITGKIGFSVAGVALIVSAAYQWRLGGTVKLAALASALVGVAMQFIWVDSATLMHPIVGAAFFFWLIVAGTILATGRVGQHLAATAPSSSTD